MTTFSDLDRRLTEDGQELHNFLWTSGWEGDRDALMDRLARDAEDLDALLEGEGAFAGVVEDLLAALSREEEGAGASLFEFLSHAFYLTAAAEDVDRGEFARAAERLEQAVGSVTIGVCSNAGCFEYVQEWEGGETDFPTYLGKLTADLEERGLAGVEAWGRGVRHAYELNRALAESESGTEEDLLARSAVLNACWAAVRSLSFRKSLNAPPRFAYDDFATVAEAVGRRL